LSRFGFARPRLWCQVRSRGRCAALPGARGAAGENAASHAAALLLAKVARRALARRATVAKTHASELLKKTVNLLGQIQIEDDHDSPEETRSATATGTGRAAAATASAKAMRRFEGISAQVSAARADGAVLRGEVALLNNELACLTHHGLGGGGGDALPKKVPQLSSSSGGGANSEALVLAVRVAAGPDEATTAACEEAGRTTRTVLANLEVSRDVSHKGWLPKQLE